MREVLPTIKYHVRSKQVKSSEKTNRIMIRSISIAIIVQVSIASLGSALNAEETSLLEQTDSTAGWPPMDDSWNYWWSYAAISGPAYWGLMNPAWFMCDKGKRQSPIDIRTNNLVFDPSLTPLKIDNNLIWAALYNDGHAILLNRTDSSKLTQTIAYSIAIDNNNIDVIADEIPKATTNKSQIETKKSSQSTNNDIDTNNNQQQRPESAPLEAGNLISQLTDRESIQMDAGPNILSAAEDLAGNLRLTRWIPLNLVNNLLITKATSSSSDDESSAIEFTNKEQSDAVSHQHERDQQQAELQQQQINNMEPQPEQVIKFTGAGLAYTYQFERIYLHFGLESTRNGSEHQLNGRQFAAELQILAYNSHLYSSFNEASMNPLGLMAISVLIELARNNSVDEYNKAPNTQTVNSVAGQGRQLVGGDQLFSRLDKIKFRGASSEPFPLNVSYFLPRTDQFVTYEGSLTVPGCYETVTWIVMNKAMYITPTQLETLKSIAADDQTSGSSSSGKLIAGNIRPVQPMNGRLIRTNIRPSGRHEPETCQRLWTRYQYDIS